MSDNKTHQSELERIAALEKRNLSLKKYLDAYEKNFIALNDAAGNCDQTETELVADLPQGVTRESFEIRQIYRKMLSEKKRNLTHALIDLYYAIGIESHDQLQ